MKVTTAKHGLRSIVTAFFLFGALLFCASSANAQAVDADLTLNWLNESEALTALDNSINGFVADQANWAPNSPQWTSDAQHIQYYKLIVGHIETGVGVPGAVNLGLFGIDGGNTTASNNNPPPAPLAQLKLDAVNLLTF